MAQDQALVNERQNAATSNRRLHERVKLLVPLDEL